MMKDSDKNNDGRIDFDGEQWPQAKHPCCAPRQGHGLRLLLSCRVPEDDGGCAVKDQTFLRPAAVPSPAPLLSREQQLHSIWPSALAGTLLCSRVPVSSHHRRLSFSSRLSPVALIPASIKEERLELLVQDFTGGAWGGGCGTVSLFCSPGRERGRAHATEQRCRGSPELRFPRSPGWMPVLSSEFPCRAARSHARG